MKYWWKSTVLIAVLGVAVNATTPEQAAARWSTFAPGTFGKIVYGDNRTGVVTTLIADNDDMCQLTMIPDSHYKTLPDTNYFVTLWFSPDAGKTFDMPVLGAVNTVHWRGPPRKDTAWIIPADTSLFGNYVTNQARIRVEDYTKKMTENDASDQSFIILNR
ncbi:MAG: hypothetical protein JXA71_06850 [Chitinispirillaceae bacterium]|nr:hypothetical protein [Chitinispirillaceae bacterium]